ncbi:MAG: type II toxin-antitoxin system RelE/ParE family toxin [Novosphingobium sp.]
MLKLIWNPEARQNVRDIIDYIGDRHPAAAIRMRHMFDDCAERLTAHPYIYRVGRVAGTREAVVHPNYIMIYEVGLDTVEIVSVVHARRQYPPGDEA